MEDVKVEDVPSPVNRGESDDVKDVTPPMDKIPILEIVIVRPYGGSRVDTKTGCLAASRKKTFEKNSFQKLGMLLSALKASGRRRLSHGEFGFVPLDIDIEKGTNLISQGKSTSCTKKFLGHTKNFLGQVLNGLADMIDPTPALIILAILSLSVFLYVLELLARENYSVDWDLDQWLLEL